MDVCRGVMREVMGERKTGDEVTRAVRENAAGRRENGCSREELRKVILDGPGHALGFEEEQQGTAAASPASQRLDQPGTTPRNLGAGDAREP